VVRDGTFVSAIERLYLDDGDDRDDAALLEDNSDMADDFNPQVVRK
jgi:hypothetical protein